VRATPLRRCGPVSPTRSSTEVDFAHCVRGDWTLKRNGPNPGGRSYDENGNETAAGSQSFAYDLANRMLSTSSGGTTMTYSCDGDGNRLQAVAGSQTTKYLWDTNGSLAQIALERDGPNALLRRYVYGQRRISMTATGSTHYYTYDALGSTANVMSSTGGTDWTYAFEPFGSISSETQNDPNAPANAMRFAGEYSDASGLYNLRARQYDPNSGRFLSQDPVFQSAAMSGSLYVYVTDRPTVMIDPTGETLQPANDGSLWNMHSSFGPRPSVGRKDYSPAILSCWRRASLRRTLKLSRNNSPASGRSLISSGRLDANRRAVIGALPSTARCAGSRQQRHRPKKTYAPSKPTARLQVEEPQS
jgi:RHS repeat-associated protein